MGAFTGLLWMMSFAVFQVPEVALSQGMVGVLAFPMMVVLALARLQHGGRG